MRNALCKSKQCQTNNWTLKRTGTVGQDRRNWWAHSSGVECLNSEVSGWAPCILPSGFRNHGQCALTLDKVQTEGLFTCSWRSNHPEGLTGMSLCNNSTVKFEIQWQSQLYQDVWNYVIIINFYQFMFYMFKGVRLDHYYAILKSCKIWW